MYFNKQNHVCILWVCLKTAFLVLFWLCVNHHSNSPFVSYRRNISYRIWTTWGWVNGDFCTNNFFSALFCLLSGSFLTKHSPFWISVSTSIDLWSQAFLFISDVAEQLCQDCNSLVMVWFPVKIPTHRVSWRHADEMYRVGFQKHGVVLAACDWVWTQ